MRKYLLLSAILFITHHSFSQNKKIEIYCKFDELTRHIEFGGLEKILPDSMERLHLFHPGRKIRHDIGVVNFMSLNGWKLVESTTERRGSSQLTIYLMKKEIEVTEADYRLILERYEKLRYR